MTKYQKLTLWLSVAAGLVAVIALVVAIWTQVQTSKYRTSHDQSKVVIQVQRDFNQKNITFSKYNGPYSFGAVFTQRYHIIINNLGFQPASITGWRIVARMPIASVKQHKSMYGWYVGMNQKLFRRNGKSVQMPITIAPEEPIGLILTVGIRVPQIAWNAVAGSFTYGVNYSYEIAEQKFSQVGYPQFGQEQLTRVQSNGNMQLTAYGRGVYEQTFIMYVTKGDGTQVSAIVTPNVSDTFVQGQNSGTKWADTKVE